MEINSKRIQGLPISCTAHGAVCHHNDDKLSNGPEDISKLIICYDLHRICTDIF